MLERYARFLCRNPRSVILAVLFVTSLLGLGLARLHVEVDPEEQLPQDHPYIRTFHRIHDLFGDWNLAVVTVEPRDGDISSPHFLTKFASISERIGELPGCSASLLQSATSANAKSIDLTGTTLRIEPLLSATPRSSAESAAFRIRLRSDPAYRDTLVSKHFSALAIYATFELTASLPGYTDVDRSIRDILRSEDDGTFASFLSGPIPLVSAISERSSSLLRLFPISLAVIGLLHLHGLRSVQAAVMPLLTGILAVVWSLGLMGHLNVPLDPLNSTTALLVLAIGAGHAVQILKRYQEEFAKHSTSDQALIETTKAIGGVTIATGLVAAISFLSLATLGTASLRTFGLFTGFGVMAAVTVELTLVLALRVLLPASSTPSADSSTTQRLLHWIAANATTRRGALTILVGYATALTLASVLALNIQADTSLKRALSSDDAVRLADDRVNSMFGGTNSLVLLIEGQQEGAITRPDTLTAIARLQREIERQPGVGKTLSIADRLLRLHQALSGDATATEIPQSANLISQYLLLYSLSGGDDLGTHITPDYRSAKVLILVKSDSTRFAKTLIDHVVELGAKLLPPDVSVQIAGSLASNVALSDTLISGKLLNIVQISLITTLIGATLLSSIVGGLLIAPPLVVAAMVNFALMGAVGIPLDITTASVTAMSVGIGADYALYFLSRFREELRVHEPRIALERTILTTGHAIFLVSSAISAGYAVLCLSGFRMLVQLGGLVSLAMISASVASLLVTPAALTLLSRSSVRFASNSTTPGESGSECKRAAG